MARCMVCQREIGDEGLAVQVWTGRRRSASVVGFQEIVPGTLNALVQTTFDDAKEEAVRVCRGCWSLNPRLFTWLLIVVGLALGFVLAMAVAGIAFEAGFVALGFLGAAVLTLAIGVPVLLAISPSRKIVRNVEQARRQREPGHAWVAFRAHWPSKPFQQQAQRQADSWEESDLFHDKWT